MPRQALASGRAPGPVRRYLTGLRASEAYLAHGIGHTRWLDLGRAGLVLAGGVRQGTLVVLSWLLSRGSTDALPWPTATGR